MEQYKAAREALSPQGIAHVEYCMRTLRSVRKLRQEPVAPEIVEFVLSLAVRAGSGSNTQPWRFVVVRDTVVKRRLADWYQRGWRILEAMGQTADSLAAPTARQRRITAAARHLAENFAAAPVVVVACGLLSRRHSLSIFTGASIYPAVQNLLLAARAAGLGATLTTMQALGERPAGGSGNGDSPAPGEPGLCRELREILGIPHFAVPAAVIPLGWPAEPFDETTRKPVSEVSFADRWGCPLI